MKTRTLLLSVLLGASALAALPTSQAAEIPGPVVCVTDPCPPYPVPNPVPGDCALKQATPDQAPFLGAMVDPRRTVWGTDAGCDIDVQSAWDCAPPSGSWVDRTVGPVHVRILVCDGGIPDRIPPITTTAAAMQPPIYCVMAPCPGPYPPPTVSWCKLESATPGANPYTTLNPREQVWGTDAGCDVDAESNWACAPPSGFWVERTIGPVHVKILVCDGGITTGPIVQLLEQIFCCAVEA